MAWGDSTVCSISGGHFNFRRVDPYGQLIPILNPLNGKRDHFQKGRVLEVAQLRLGVRIIHPAVVLLLEINHPAAREGKGLGRMQVRPLDQRKGELRFEQPERGRVDIDVQRAVEVAVEVQPVRLEERTLPVQRAVGIVARRPRSDAVAAGEQAGDRSPVGRHGGILLYVSPQRA